MRLTVLTLFPEIFDSILSTSLTKKAIDNKLLEVDLVNYREFAEGRHRVVDDTPYGGGAGMVIKVEPVARAIDAVRQQDPRAYVILLSPQGQIFSHSIAKEYSRLEHLVMICGRYEGVDERIRDLVDQEISIGNFVLSGGEPAAWVVLDSVSRLIPGVLGSSESIQEESFCDSLLEYPQYTRPRVFRDKEVPKVLLSGDHAAINKWRRQQALLRTQQRRPELMCNVEMTEEERNWLADNSKG
jgi:tRNA (guanine37-N1)-methyltransferase